MVSKVVSKEEARSATLFCLDVFCLILTAVGLKFLSCCHRASSASSTQQQQQQQQGSLFADVPLAKRVNHYIEWSGSGILLDTASAILSLLTVMTYMVGCKGWVQPDRRQLLVQVLELW